MSARTPAPRVLVVEDELLVAKDIARTLEGFGLAVCGQAASADEAVASATVHRPDLVLMDVRLRGSDDGIEAARRIRDVMDVPFVFLTAFADQGTVERARDLQAYGYVLKPFNERELHIAVTMALAKHSVVRELSREVSARSAALAASEERYRLLVDSVQDYAILALDPDGRVASWNPGAERIIGWTADEIIGRPVDLFHTAEDRAAGKPSAGLAVAARLGRYEDEGWRVRKDGSRFWAHIVTIAQRDAAGTLTGFARVTADLTDRRRYEDELATASERLRALAARVDATSEREKTLLAREIHDVLGQELTGLKMDTGWLLRALERSELAPAARAPLVERLQAMAKQLDGAVQSVRRIATGLRPGVLDDLGLVAAIEWQSRQFEQRSGLRVELALPAERLAVERERATAIYRILQELLTNVARHARARELKIHLAPLRDALVLEVQDDGAGILPAQLEGAGSLGILGMRERAALFGGSLHITGAPGAGTRAVLRMPLT
jgi:PAS domain S-box-containing protein